MVAQGINRRKGPTLTTITQITSRNWRDLIRPKSHPSGSRIRHRLLRQIHLLSRWSRGFGITVGNSLRRVLLASLQGAAITAVRVEGALHEFTTIPDVVRRRDGYHPQSQGGGVQVRVREDLFRFASRRKVPGRCLLVTFS